MGGGIAYVTACKGGLPVQIKDIQPRGINHALKYSWDLLNKQVRQRRLRPVERDRQMALISGTTDYQGFAHRDVVIEAVFEDLALKQRMVSEVEQYGGPQTIFASNTSSLPIGDIAAHASHLGGWSACIFSVRWKKCRWLGDPACGNIRRPSPRWCNWLNVGENADRRRRQSGFM